MADQNNKSRSNYFTAVFAVPEEGSKAIATAICEMPHWIAGSWSDALADRDAARALAATPAVPAVDALTGYEPHREYGGSMDEVTDGDYVKRADVQALLATPSTAPDEQVKLSDDELLAAMDYPKASLKREDWDPKTRKPFPKAEQASCDAALRAAPADTDLALRADFEAYVTSAQSPTIAGEEWASIEVKKAWMVWQACAEALAARFRAEGGNTQPDSFNLTAPEATSEQPTNAGVRKARELLPKLHSLFNRLRNPESLRIKSEQDSRTVGDASELCRTIVNAFEATSELADFVMPTYTPPPPVNWDEEAPATEQMGGAQVAKPDAVYSYECRQPGTNPDVWCEFFSREKPDAAISERAWLRNVREYVPTESAAEGEATEHKPLTLEAIADLARQCKFGYALPMESIVLLVRTIEQHHGITGGGK